MVTLYIATFVVALPLAAFAWCVYDDITNH